MDLTDIIIFAAVGYIIFQLARLVINIFVINQVGKEIRNHLNEIVHEVKVEKINGVEYWFDADTNQFFAQGNDQDEVIKILKDRFPTHIFVFPKEGILGAPNWTITKAFNPKEYFND
jgi:hypothetical protein